MPSQLISILEKEAHAERERMLADAREQAEQILSTARAEAERTLTEARQQQEAALQNARVRAQSTANLQAQALVLEQKDQALAEVFRRAEALLDRIPTSNRYAGILERLVDEAVAGFDGRVIIETSPTDAELVRALARRRKLDAEVRPAEDVDAGVRVTSADGRYIVLNTLRLRLERARPTLLSEVAQILWG